MSGFESRFAQGFLQRTQREADVPVGKTLLDDCPHFVIAGRVQKIMPRRCQPLSNQQRTHSRALIRCVDESRFCQQPNMFVHCVAGIRRHISNRPICLDAKKDLSQQSKITFHIDKYTP